MASWAAAVGPAGPPAIQLWSTAYADSAVPGDDASQQDDEILALQSILGDAAVTERTCAGADATIGSSACSVPRGVTVRLPIAVPEDLRPVWIAFDASDSAAALTGAPDPKTGAAAPKPTLLQRGASDGGSAASAVPPPRPRVLRASHLPPVCLEVGLVDSYPSTTPPVLAVTAPWLSVPASTALAAELYRVWSDDAGGPGCVCLYQCVDWLQREAVAWLLAQAGSPLAPAVAAALAGTLAASSLSSSSSSPVSVTVNTHDSRVAMLAALEGDHAWRYPMRPEYAPPPATAAAAPTASVWGGGAAAAAGGKLKKAAPSDTHRGGAADAPAAGPKWGVGGDMSAGAASGSGSAAGKPPTPRSLASQLSDSGPKSTGGSGSASAFQDLYWADTVQRPAIVVGGCGWLPSAPPAATDAAAAEAPTSTPTGAGAASASGSVPAAPATDDADGDSLAALVALAETLANHDAVALAEEWASAYFDCEVCFRSSLKSSLCVCVPGCGHVFCLSCLQAHCETLIGAGDVLAITCPACDTSLNQTFIKRLLVGAAPPSSGGTTAAAAAAASSRQAELEKVYNRYEELCLKRAFDAMSDIVYCPDPACGGPAVVERSSQQRKREFRVNTPYGLYKLIYPNDTRLSAEDELDKDVAFSGAGSGGEGLTERADDDAAVLMEDAGGGIRRGVRRAAGGAGTAAAGAAAAGAPGGPVKVATAPSTALVAAARAFQEMMFCRQEMTRFTPGGSAGGGGGARAVLAATGVDSGDGSPADEYLHTITCLVCGVERCMTCKTPWRLHGALCPKDPVVKFNSTGSQLREATLMLPAIGFAPRALEPLFIMLNAGVPDALLGLTDGELLVRNQRLPMGRRAFQWEPVRPQTWTRREARRLSALLRPHYARARSIRIIELAVEAEAAAQRAAMAAAGAWTQHTSVVSNIRKIDEKATAENEDLMGVFEKYFGTHAKETLEQATFFLANTKACPGCKVRLEKQEGCNHVKCSRCSTHVCWICGSNITSEGYNHFSTSNKTSNCKAQLFAGLHDVGEAVTAKELMEFATKDKTRKLLMADVPGSDGAAAVDDKVAADVAAMGIVDLTRGKA